MKVGVAGCGSIGTRYVGWLTELGVEVIAFDPVPERRDAARAAGARWVVDDYRSLLDGGVQRVLIASPPTTHTALAQPALEAGLDVLIEKPLAADLSSAMALCTAAANAPGRAWVVCNMRFHPGIQCVRDNLVRIGRPLFARAHFGHRLAQMRPAGLGAYAADADAGGGVILDCIHELDYLRWLFGPIDSVDTLAARIGPDEINAEDYAEIRLRHADGVHVALHLDFLMRWKRRGLEVHGTEGGLIWASEGKQPERCSVWFTEYGAEHVLLQCPDVDGTQPYRSMLRAFLDAPESLQTVTEGAAVLAVALRARGAAPA